MLSKIIRNSDYEHSKKHKGNFLKLLAAIKIATVLPGTHDCEECTQIYLKTCSSGNFIYFTAKEANRVMGIRTPIKIISLRCVKVDDGHIKSNIKLSKKLNKVWEVIGMISHAIPSSGLVSVELQDEDISDLHRLRYSRKTNIDVMVRLDTLEKLYADVRNNEKLDEKIKDNLIRDILWKMQHY